MYPALSGCPELSSTNTATNDASTRIRWAQNPCPRPMTFDFPIFLVAQGSRTLADLTADGSPVRTGLRLCKERARDIRMLTNDATSAEDLRRTQKHDHALISCNLARLERRVQSLSHASKLSLCTGMLIAFAIALSAALLRDRQAPQHVVFVFSLIARQSSKSQTQVSNSTNQYGHEAHHIVGHSTRRFALG